ncbi:branched-chain amino acid aminotransferase [Formosa algae]|uniref:Branched-chain-amino-acid aminotransferase n=1 Tax=Formosa algae TaxID=225843 RepID=A0A9X0YIV5_9FLAO|nr:branched-chain amino acid aminotransferase [Formosa algae]MBP1839587.1 branched-chain amino acid aminotransferase [Formosa algae]MDQ0334891.1 branched-chain amino acid aminotransferase [Formosa algae]OEI80608.1 branched chain amino acid aminotransferase [Formosa algae]
MTNTIEITKAQTSKIHEVDFENLSFGKVFTDHMFICDFKNGEWQQPEITPYAPLTLDPSARVFHYGQAVFEGMKAFKDDANKVWLFRPEDNLLRINKSAERLAMPEFPKDVFMEGLKALINLDEAWVKPGFGNSLYIRPFVIATEPAIAASPALEYKFLIICSPAQSYYSGDVRVLIAEQFSRSANGGVGFAKAAGNYAAQFYPTSLANQEGFQQIIWTDADTHEFLEEAGTMNVFFRINDTLVTAPTNERILDGITRKSIIQIAQDSGIAVEVRPIKVSELIEASKSGALKEIFGSGTAAVVSPISAFSYKGDVFEIPKDVKSFSSIFKEKLLNIQYNKSEDPYGWRQSI